MFAAPFHVIIPPFRRPGEEVILHQAWVPVDDEHAGARVPGQVRIERDRRRQAAEPGAEDQDARPCSLVVEFGLGCVGLAAPGRPSPHPGDPSQPSP